MCGAGWVPVGRPRQHVNVPVFTVRKPGAKHNREPSVSGLPHDTFGPGSGTSRKLSRRLSGRSLVTYHCVFKYLQCIFRTASRPKRAQVATRRPAGDRMSARTSTTQPPKRRVPRTNQAKADKSTKGRFYRFHKQNQNNRSPYSGGHNHKIDI